MTQYPLHTRIIDIGRVKLGGRLPFVLISGPCQIETLEHARALAHNIITSCEKTQTPFIFKASYDKANRSSLHAPRGPGIDRGLEILAHIRDEFGCPVLSDVHTPQECEIAAQVVDVLQIPAFLSRQTDLLLAAGETGRAINVKKGQFMAPQDMKNVAAKINSTGNHNIMMCERGTSFGYNTLVNDFRSIPIMAQTGYPIVFDATHSVQKPSSNGVSSGGERAFVPILARAACAIGVQAVFIETHQDPDHAPSDGPNMIHIQELGPLLHTLVRHDALAKGDI